ncbi:MAG: signal peptidase I [Treponema sp.]
MNKELYKLSYTLKKQRQHRIIICVFFVLTVFASIMLIRTFLLIPVRERSVSMQPDVSNDTSILFTPVVGTPQRGDVVLLKPRSTEKHLLICRALNTLISFFTAQQFMLFDKDNTMGRESQIRRIVGLPGDTIYMRGYIIFVQPEGKKHFLTEFECVKKSYDVNVITVPVGWDSNIGVSGNFDKILLGKDQYFVLGDNRCSCIDSRLWGPVNIKDIKAKGLVVYFPFSKLRLL